MKVVTELMAGLCNDVMTHKPSAFQRCKYTENGLALSYNNCITMYLSIDT